MTIWQALFLGFLQGATELFPVSSLGHAVIVPTLLHWTYKQSDPTFLPFLVLLHLGTAGALLILFWRDWVNIIRGFFTAAVRGRIETTDERLAMLLVVGTVPTGVVGVFFQKQLQGLFASPRVAASRLIVNAVLPVGSELPRRRAERLAEPTGKDRRRQEEAGTEGTRPAHAGGRPAGCETGRWLLRARFPVPAQRRNASAKQTPDPWRSAAPCWCGRAHQMFRRLAARASA